MASGGHSYELSGPWLSPSSVSPPAVLGASSPASIEHMDTKDSLTLRGKVRVIRRDDVVGSIGYKNIYNICSLHVLQPWMVMENSVFHADFKAVTPDNTTVSIAIRSESNARPHIFTP